MFEDNHLLKLDPPVLPLTSGLMGTFSSCLSLPQVIMPLTLISVIVGMSSEYEQNVTLYREVQLHFTPEIKYRADGVDGPQEMEKN